MEHINNKLLNFNLGYNSFYYIDSERNELTYEELNDNTVLLPIIRFRINKEFIDRFSIFSGIPENHESFEILKLFSRVTFRINLDDIDADDYVIFEDFFVFDYFDALRTLSHIGSKLPIDNDKLNEIRLNCLEYDTVVANFPKWVSEFPSKDLIALIDRALTEYLIGLKYHFFKNKINFFLEVFDQEQAEVLRFFKKNKTAEQ